MTDAERTAVKNSMEAWRRAAPVLARVREEDIRAARTISAIAAFRGMALAKVRTHPPASTSGLVEQQRLFARLARRP